MHCVIVQGNADTGNFMEKTQTIDLGVVVEKRRIDHPWQEWSWLPVAVIPGAPKVEGWTVMTTDPDCIQYHAATLPLELHRKETEGYLVNLADRVPSVYVVLRDNDDDDEDEEGGEDTPMTVHLVSASAFDAQDYMDSGEEIVEAVPMPPDLIAWVQAFADKHHVEERFIKRKRDKLKIEETKFGQEPLAEIRVRQQLDKGDNGNV